MKFRNSVTKFIVYTLAAGIVLYSALIIFIVKSNLNSGLVTFFNDEVTDLSRVLEDEMENRLNSIKSIAHLIQQACENDYEKGNFDEDTINNYADSVKKTNGIKSVAFCDSYGVQTSNPLYGTINQSQYLNNVLSGSEFSNFEYEDGSNSIFAKVTFPLRHHSIVFGAIEIVAPVTTQEIVEKVSKDVNCDVTIFKGNIRIFTTIDGMIGSTLNNPEIFEAINKDTSVTLENKINGNKYISHYFPFKDKNRNILTTFYLGKELHIVNHVSAVIFKPLVVAILIFMALSIACFLFMIHCKITTPLKNVKIAIANLSSGDADLTKRLDTSKGDEFAELSDEVNKFIAMLQKIIKELNESQSTLNVVSTDLGNNAQDSASATAEILANIESVRKQSQNQAEAVQNTSSVLERSFISVDVLSELIENQTESVTESSAAIEEMLGNISAVTTSVRKMSKSFGTLGSTVDDGKQKLGSVDQKVNQIAEQSKMLIEANKVIAQIASETNLLAMNAAIEAAHAGDTGKGFSVVAEEIRKLAENSSVQSKNISSELNGISTSITDVVDLSRDSQTAFEAIVNQLGSTDEIIREIYNAMEEQQTASKKIFEALSAMKNQSSEVAIKAQEMNKGITDVASDMNTVSQISSTILGSMDEMTTGMQQIGDATQNVSDLAGQTKENIGLMSNKLNQFKI